MKIRTLIKRSSALCILLLQFMPFAHLAAQASTSQGRENFDIKYFRSGYFSLTTDEQVGTLGHLSGITVIDARADTAHVGFMQKKPVDAFVRSIKTATGNPPEQKVYKWPTFLCLARGLQLEAQAYFERNIHFSNDSRKPILLAVIKRLWLSDELGDANAGMHDRELERSTAASGIDVRIEFFLQDNNAYYPLYRFDSTIRDVMTTSSFAAGYISKAFRLSLARMALIDGNLTAVLNKRPFNLAEITGHNTGEYKLPVITDAVLQAGVYLSFEEFKYNNPSRRLFALAKDKRTDAVFIKQPDGTEVLTRQIWGYSDGKNAYIRSAENFFLLQRSANAFYIFGAKATVVNSIAANRPIDTPDARRAPVSYNTGRILPKLEPFQLNWHTGMLY